MTQDINVHDQFSIIIRYATFNINERLVGFIKCISETGKSLYIMICKLLEKSGLDLNKLNKWVGSFIDGAANMHRQHNGFMA